MRARPSVDPNANFWRFLETKVRHRELDAGFAVATLRPSVLGRVDSKLVDCHRFSCARLDAVDCHPRSGDEAGARVVETIALAYRRFPRESPHVQMESELTAHARSAHGRDGKTGPQRTKNVRQFSQINRFRIESFRGGQIAASRAPTPSK